MGLESNAARIALDEAGQLLKKARSAAKSAEVDAKLAEQGVSVFPRQKPVNVPALQQRALASVKREAPKAYQQIKDDAYKAIHLGEPWHLDEHASSVMYHGTPREIYSPADLPSAKDRLVGELKPTQDVAAKIPTRKYKPEPNAPEASWFSSDFDVAGRYANKKRRVGELFGERGPLREDAITGKITEGSRRGDTRGVYQYFDTSKNPREVNAFGRSYDNVPRPRVLRAAKDAGHDAVKFINMDDPAFITDMEVPGDAVATSDVTAILNPKRVKRASIAGEAAASLTSKGIPLPVVAAATAGLVATRNAKPKRNPARY